MNFDASPLDNFTKIDTAASWLGVDPEDLENELLDASVYVGTICGQLIFKNSDANEFFSSRCSDDEFWTMEQTTDFFGRSRDTVDRWVREGKLHKRKDRTFSRNECEKFKLFLLTRSVTLVKIRSVRIPFGHQKCGLPPTKRPVFCSLFWPLTTEK